MAGLPWLDQPVMLHSSRMSKCKLSPAQCQYQRGYWRYWYHADHVYALGTVYFAIAMIAVFIMSRLLMRSMPQIFTKKSPWRRVVAFFRFLTYRGFRVEILNWSSLPLGVILLGVAAAVFFFGMTLGPKPYYWPNTKKTSYGDSPPIATRAGWMSLGLLPFVVATAAKLNLITQLTGVSHEKLQVFHQWSSWLMFILALVHTFPFIVYNVWYGDMEMEYNMSSEYWTGIAAIIPQAYLTIFSLAPVRKRFYETFKSTHYLATIIFVIFFFIHCDFRLSSWDYFIAAAVVYFAPLFSSWLRTCLEYGFGWRAKLYLLPTGLLRIVIPGNFVWYPGQHIFIRFLTLGVNSLTAHPFTICSLPESGEIVLYIRVRGGMTARLAALARKQPGSSIRVLLDGPYGGMQEQNLAAFDKALIISGGSGAGFTLPLIENIVREPYLSKRAPQLMPKAGEEPSSSTRNSGPVHDLHIILATRNEAIQEWYANEVKSILQAYDVPQDSTNVHVNVHVTGEASPAHLSSLASLDISDENIGVGDERKQSIVSHASAASSWITTAKGRPDLPNEIHQATTSVASEGAASVGIAVCGPPSMLQDVRNAAAAAQARILAGEKGTAREVYLHTEHFE